jgi:hypothetical protein
MPQPHQLGLVQLVLGLCLNQTCVFNQTVLLVYLRLEGRTLDLLGVKLFQKNVDVACGVVLATLVL